MGVVMGARFLGHDVPEHVAGVDLFHELLAMSAREGFSVFLLGAKARPAVDAALGAGVAVPGAAGAAPDVEAVSGDECEVRGGVGEGEDAAAAGRPSVGAR